jgi:hypothetical protein
MSLFMMAGNMIFVGHSLADTWQSELSSKLSTEFDSNPSMSPSYPGSAWRVLFEPNYSVMKKEGENEFKGGIALQLARSLNTSVSQDLNNPNVFLDWSRKAEFGEVDISSKYSEIATREAGIDATGLVPVNSTLTARNLSARWSKDLNELNKLSSSGLYEMDTYKGGNYVDYSTWKIDLKLSHELSEKMSTFGRVSSNNYKPANSGIIATPTVLILDSYTDITWGLIFKGDYLGWSVQAAESRDGMGQTSRQGTVTAEYIGLLSQMNFDVGRLLMPSGLGGYVVADQANAKWSYALNEYSKAGIDWNWQKNLSAINLFSTTTTIISGAWIEHDLNQEWKMRTYYAHRVNQGGEGAGASSNLLGLSFAYLHSNF